MANVSSNNLTTLYSGGGVNIRPTSAYGNANVVALLNAGTDGGNTVTNIVATGNLTIGNITANGNVTADYFIGNLTGSVSNANYANFAGNLINGTSNVNTNGSGGNITISVGGNANILNVTGTHAIASNLKISANAFALGNSAGGNTQGINSVALGALAGNTQGDYGVAVGSGAGIRQGNYTISIGRESARGGIIANSSSGTNTVAIGTFAGHYSIGNDIVAIGQRAKFASLGGGNNSIGIGSHSGYSGDRANTIAIGAYAGYSNIGTNSIAIGANAGYTDLANNSIVLNATGSNLDQTTANTFTVKPVRNVSTPNVMFYNNTTGEITYGVSSIISNGTSNVSIPVANGNITFSANGVANIGVLDTTGNLTITNTIIAESANLTGTYNIDSSGYYYSTRIDLANAGAISLPSFYFSGDFTSGSNLVTNVALTDGFSSGYPFNLADYATELTNSGVTWAQASPPFDDTYYPVNTIISSVDAPNNQIYLSNNASFSGTGINNFTGTWLSNASTNSYYVATAPFITNAISTDATTNNIGVTDFNTFNDGFVNPGDSIQFIGTSFGNITAGVDYFVNNIDYGNSTFSISTSNGGPDLGLTTATGNLIIVYNPFTAQNIQPLSAGYYYAGPWSTTPVLTDFTQSPAGTVNSGTVLNFTGFVKPVDFNSNISPPVSYAGQFTRVDNGMVVADGSFGTPTLTGKLSDVFPVNGVVLVHTGLDANISGSRTNYQLVDYTDNSSGSASITNPGNPPALGFTSFNGNINSDVNDQYARSGRTFGRIAWSGAQQTSGIYFQSPGSSPPAGIYVQALGDWNDATNANLPMTMSFQYSPLNAATGQGTSYKRINRTFLQASNNSTYIGGATNIQFKPLARSNNGTNNRSPSALGNVSINPQTFVDISGYTQGNALSNGAGAVLNVTTTSSSWNGNVALRLSRTVGNTGNMEFVLPVASSNTMTLVDNASGNTIATFTNGDVKVANLTVDTGGFAKLASYTAAALTAITGQIGWMAAVSDSAGGGDPNGMIAFWDTTNARWSYVHNNGAV